MTQKTNEILLEPDTSHYLAIMELRYEENLVLKPDMRIRLGIDFGTSFTKVAWRVSDDTCYPLCFGERTHLLEDYLVPSVIVFNNGNVLTGFETNSQDNKIPNFKICLACESSREETCTIKKCMLSEWKIDVFPMVFDDEEAKFATSVYLAKLINLSKLRIREELESEGHSRSKLIKWSICVPVPEKYIENSPVANCFEETVKIAWLMAGVLEEVPGLQNVSSLFSCFKIAKEYIESLKNGGKFDCSVYPEVGAEVAAITMSPTSEPGLYAFVDIGAGTVDASVFRFFRYDGDAHRPPYAAEVFKLGAAYFETEAKQLCPAQPLDLIKSVKEENYPKALKNTPTLTEIQKALSFVAEKINQKTEKELIGLFREGYSKECNSDTWRALKLVLGGGGASIKTYQNAAKRAFSIKDKKNPYEPKSIELSVPRDFKMRYLPIKYFHRFAVAYGLSFGKANLPEVVTTKDVEPIRTLNQHIVTDPTNDG